MAMIAVQLLLEKLASLLLEEYQLVGGVPEGIDELRDHLDSMKSFLKDAEVRSESHEALKTWVKQVRDVAYDTEDVLEEFMLRLALPRGHGFSHSLCSCYGYMLKFKARHELAVKIQKINKRVKGISERRNAFSFNLRNGTEKWHDPRLDSLFIDEADVLGIENSKSQLISWLVEGENELTSISVVGMGGLGKTTLVKKVCDSQSIRRHFDCESWVTVSKSFTPVELLRAALRGFLAATEDPTRHPEIESMTNFQLIAALQKHLQGKRYVIVFDDVWSIDAWEVVKYAFPDCKCSSRIIFTTRISSIAASIENTRHVYHLQPLQEKEAWTLFCKKAFRGENRGVCPEELEEMSRNILRKCEGLPLAIVAIGGLLARKNKYVTEWKKVLDNLAVELTSDNKLGSLRRILLLSYDDLPYHLKSCYLYLSVFPEDYLIKRTKLIRLWIVERFVEEKHGFTVEEIAEDYFSELVSRSMIQVVEMNFLNRVRTCRVHDLMREIIQLKSEEESLVMILNERHAKQQNEKVRRMSIHDSSKDLPSTLISPYLRSLLFFMSVGHSFSFGQAFFCGFRLLRVLELELAPVSEFPLELVELIHLRYLSFRRTIISQLPESIGKLENLEILDLKNSIVSSLPMGILKLKHLCELRVYGYHYGSSMFFREIRGMRVPSRLGRLTNLQKLGCVEVNDDIELLRDLGELTQLKRLGVLELKEEHGRDLCYTLQKLQHLTALLLNSTDADQSLQLNSLTSPPKFLHSLFLKCRLTSIPEWIFPLRCLTKLVLHYSNLKNDPLKALQDLPRLLVLELRQAFEGEELVCDAGGYPRLQKLGLYLLDRLKSVTVPEGAMPRLRRLEIAACGELKMVPQGVEHLKEIQDLLLWDMPSEFLKRVERSSGVDFWRVHHIPRMTYIYEDRGRWLSYLLPS